MRTEDRALDEAVEEAFSIQPQCEQQRNSGRQRYREQRIDRRVRQHLAEIRLCQQVFEVLKTNEGLGRADKIPIEHAQVDHVEDRIDEEQGKHDNRRSDHAIRTQSFPYGHVIFLQPSPNVSRLLWPPRRAVSLRSARNNRAARTES